MSVLTLAQSAVKAYEFAIKKKKNLIAAHQVLVREYNPKFNAPQYSSKDSLRNTHLIKWELLEGLLFPI